MNSVKKIIASSRVAHSPPRKEDRIPALNKSALRRNRSRSTLRCARLRSSSGIALSTRVRSMTTDNLEDINETNAAIAPKKNVGAVACEKMWDNRTASGMNSFN